MIDSVHDEFHVLKHEYEDDCKITAEYRSATTKATNLIKAQVKELQRQKREHDGELEATNRRIKDLHGVFETIEKVAELRRRMDKYT